MQRHSVTRAAESLGVSQPAVSRLLADFEESVGFALFERRRGRLVPTAEACALSEEVERAFVGLERVAHAAGQIRARRRGALTVAGTFDLAADFLPHMIAAFAHEHDGVEMTLLTLDAAEVVEHVGTHRCDLGFVAAQVAHPRVRLEALGQWPMRCIVPHGHRLARKRVVSVADCAGERFVSFAKLSEPRTSIDRVFTQSGVERRMDVEATLAQSIVGLVEAGAGIALIDPVSAARAATRVVVKRFSPVLPHTLYAVRRAEPSQPVLADAFVRSAAGALARLR